MSGEGKGLRESRKSSILDVLILRCLLGIERRYPIGGWIYMSGERTSYRDIYLGISAYKCFFKTTRPDEITQE